MYLIMSMKADLNFLTQTISLKIINVKVYVVIKSDRTNNSIHKHNMNIDHILRYTLNIYCVLAGCRVCEGNNYELIRCLSFAL